MMIENNLIKSIINLYFGKHFSKYSCIQFARWINPEPESSQKRQTVDELWEYANATVVQETYKNWAKFYSKLYVEDYKLQKNIPFNKKRLNHVEVADYMLFTSGANYWVTPQKKRAEFPDMTQVFVSYEESRIIRLPDGSTVLGDARSSLVYPKNFAKTKNRTTSLSREDTFAAHKNNKQPFIVITSHLNAQTLGTVFPVEAYCDDTLSTTLEEGNILVSVSEGYFFHTVLKSNQQLIYSNKEHTATVQEIDPSLYNMKRNRYLIVEHASFYRLKSTLERKFNLTIPNNSNKYIDVHYTIQFYPNEE